MIAYFDTSAFLKLFLSEPGAAIAREVWTAADVALSSALLYPEGRAALAAGARLNRLELPPARQAFEHLFAGVDLVAAAPDLLRRAGDLAEHHGLRGYDAVHLASAESVRDQEVVFVCADRRLTEAAAALELDVAGLTR